MLIRTRILAGLLGLFGALGIGIFATIFLFILPRIEGIERQDLQATLKQLNQNIDKELQRLANFAVDWGEWDDTYEYIVAPTKAYEESNMPSDSFSLDEINMDLLMMINAEHKVVWRGYSKDFPTPENVSLFLTEYFSEQSIYARTINESWYGIVETEVGPLMLAAQPIVRSNGSGEPRGVLLFGHLISGEFIDSLGTLVKSHVNAAIVPSNHQSQSIEFIDRNRSVSKLRFPLVNDHNHEIEFTLQAQRPFFNHQIVEIIYLVGVTLLVGLVSVILLYGYLQKTLVKPLVVLRRQAKLLERGKRINQFYEPGTDDEISDLADSFKEMALSLQTSQKELETERNRYRHDSYTDPLTQLNNRRYLEHFLDNERNWLSFGFASIIMLDIDHFKQINDQYGHDVGDIVLKQLAGCMQDCLRSTDIVARTGGEEFCIYTSLPRGEGIGELIERLRTTIDSREFGRENDSFSLSCSFGACIIPLNNIFTPTRSWGAFMKIADLCLYAAKNSGRDGWVGLSLSPDMAPQHYPQSANEIRARLRERSVSISGEYSLREPVTW